VSGAIGPYTFAWSNGASTQNITSVNAGTYTVIVSDANGCTTTHSATITQPAPIDITSTSVNPSCNGNNNGSISLTTVGGTSPYTYAWSNSATSEDITNLTVGNYIVTVNDANACSALISSTITEPTALMVSATSTPVSCFGGNNGATNVTTSGGTTGYVFNWSNGVTTEDLNTIVAGSYTLTVTDNNNCTATRNVVITQPNLLSTTISSNNILCNSASTGTVDLMVNGGTIPYNYNWSNAATTEDLSTLSAGGYSVTVTDANNCSATNSTTLTQPSALVVSETHLDVLCNGAATGMIDITATGGTGNLSYNWSNGDNAQDISGVFAGNYTVTVSDANTCSVTQNITIQQPTPFIIGLQYNNVACNGGVDGNINLSISGGTPPYTFDWNNEANTEDLTNIAAGNYFVIINDVNNCVANANTTITQPNILSLTFTQTNLSCFNDNKGSIDINTEGGSFPFSYNWNDGTNTQDRNNLKAGTYDVTVTDVNACQEVIQGIVITNPSEITVNLQITDIDCGSTNKGNILTQVIGGAGNYSFNWSNGSTANQITNQPTGSYSLTVADANGCTQSASGFINTLPQLQITSLIDQLVCVQDRGSIDVTVAGGTTPFNFSWNTGSTTEDLNNIQPGNYSLLVTDANGCTISETFNVINTNSFNVNTTGSATITMGETAILNAVTTGSNQTTYNWTPAINHTCPNCQSTTVQPGSTTLYTVIATDTNGCIAQDTVTVKVIADYNIFTPNAFTPNGDGNNDYLQIFGNLAGVKKLDLMIFNRWGEKVYETNDVNFQWDGRFKGDLIESSVLVYVMKIVHLDGYNQKVFKGSITILR
jgi:gliding motility-associated-like protein